MAYTAVGQISLRIISKFCKRCLSFFFLSLYNLRKAHIQKKYNLIHYKNRVAYLRSRATFRRPEEEKIKSHSVNYQQKQQQQQQKLLLQ